MESQFGCWNASFEDYGDHSYLDALFDRPSTPPPSWSPNSARRTSLSGSSESSSTTQYCDPATPVSLMISRNEELGPFPMTPTTMSPGFGMTTALPCRNLQLSFDNDSAGVFTCSPSCRGSCQHSLAPSLRLGNVDSFGFDNSDWQMSCVPFQYPTATPLRRCDIPTLRSNDQDFIAVPQFTTSLSYEGRGRDTVVPTDLSGHHEDIASPLSMRSRQTEMSHFERENDIYDCGNLARPPTVLHSITLNPIGRRKTTSHRSRQIRGASHADHTQGLAHHCSTPHCTFKSTRKEHLKRHELKHSKAPKEFFCALALHGGPQTCTIMTRSNTRKEHKDCLDTREEGISRKDNLYQHYVSHLKPKKTERNKTVEMDFLFWCIRRYHANIDPEKIIDRVIAQCSKLSTFGVPNTVYQLSHPKYAEFRQEEKKPRRVFDYPRNIKIMRRQQLLTRL